MKSAASLMDLIAAVGLIVAGFIAVMLAATSGQHALIDLLQLLFGAAMVAVGAITCDDKIARRASKYPLTQLVVGIAFIALSAMTLLSRHNDASFTTGFVVLIGVGALGFAVAGLLHLVELIREHFSDTAEPAEVPVDAPIVEQPHDTN